VQFLVQAMGKVAGWWIGSGLSGEFSDI
jgi:hypothetical protein